MTDALSADAQKALALDLVLDAWDQALAKGVEPEVIASVAIFAALADMVDQFGAEPVADFCGDLPARVRAGEFTLDSGESEPN